MEIDDSREKITVLATFATVIDANLAKTKLDAYGIPCFLSDENLATLYPMNFLQAGQVRLHVFEQDLAGAREILEEQDGTTSNNRSHRIDTAPSD